MKSLCSLYLLLGWDFFRNIDKKTIDHVAQVLEGNLCPEYNKEGDQNIDHTE